MITIVVWAALLSAALAFPALAALAARRYQRRHATREADSLMLLADATRERVDCGCRLWDDGQPGWVPCDRHLAAMIDGLGL